MAATMIPGPTGATRLFAIVGDPIAQVKAPSLLNPLFHQHGVDAVMVAVHTRPEHLARVIRGLQAMDNLDGMLLTIPHKFAACEFADELSLAVQISGSTNAIRRSAGGRWEAENFDGLGFVRGVQRAGYLLAGVRVLLAGGGGAGSAIAVALLQAGVCMLYLQEPDRDKAQRLLTRLNQQWPGRATLAGPLELASAQMVINATPLGLVEQDPLPIDVAALSAGTLVADIIMQPAQTRLLLAAQAAGHPVHPGVHMLSEQMVCYRDFFQF
ncbi:shikimate dehydrogenase [Pseudomonas fluorescens]|uniref:shikimate dehydrogenase family protein n=1 Tax=Pseudomonas fluorescens TaxID=294 RepID=UPI0019090296|nr:shikimate dehydrogenase [Pseudomonas fluorescens]MBD8094596.1 shikimate dehydrogenase [Pseudomonas fluorescens]MBD8720493.1 shikimate dehydrogenase [Pseudomonas fluorescens]